MDERSAPPKGGGPATPSETPFRAAGFLISQLGMQSSKRFAERLDPLGITPRHFALLRHIANSEGASQQALGEALGIPASRMVAFIDELEQRGLLERRPHPTDRRIRALHLTAAGSELLGRAIEVAAKHEH